MKNGTGKNGQVKGYNIGGKTGTSEDGVNTGKYVASFVGVASINNPELVILVTLYNPTGEGGHGGGGTAGPVVSQVLSEVLPYIELKKDKETEEDSKESVIVPNLTNKTISEAKKELKKQELELEIETELEEYNSESIIVEQIPKPGIKITKGSKIICEIK